MPELAPDSGPLLPPLALVVYIACVAGAGALANCALLAALLRRSANGLYSIIVQLAVADLILLGTSIPPELWSCNARTWSFGRHACIAYRGLNVFSSTASLYLVVTIGLHALATISLQEKAAHRISVKIDRDDDEEIRSSRHSLVASDTSTPRTMNLDYRIPDTRIRIAPPAAFVWVLSASLSVPEFVLATTVHLNQDVVLCTLVDTSHRLNMHSLLAVFNLFLPTVIMSTVLVLIIIKLKSKKRRTQNSDSETRPALKLSLWLFFVYGTLAAPRSIVMAYRLYSTSTVEDDYALEQPENTLALVSVLCSCAYLAGALIRPLLCVVLLPKLRQTFLFGLVSHDVDEL